MSTPGPFVKCVMIKSSKDMVNASKKPEDTPGRISGNTTLKKAYNGEAPSIQGGLVSADVRLPQLWQNTQDYIGNVKGNMCNQDCLKSKGKSTCDE